MDHRVRRLREYALRDVVSRLIVKSGSKSEEGMVFRAAKRLIVTAASATSTMSRQPVHAIVTCLGMLEA